MRRQKENRSAMYREDVYLLSNVFEPEKLSAEIAGRFYKMRWGVEIFYRSFKQTLNQMNFVVQKGVTMPRKGIEFMGLVACPREAWAGSPRSHRVAFFGRRGTRRKTNRPQILLERR